MFGEFQALLLKFDPSKKKELEEGAREELRRGIVQTEIISKISTNFNFSLEGLRQGKMD